MSTVLNWQLREHQWRFREDPGDGLEARFPVLINLILHSNVRGRAWPSRKTIAREIGVREHTVTDALKWLFDHGAIYNVPHKYRVGYEEGELQPRKYVLQLTGVIKFGDLIVPYLYVPDLEDELARTLKELTEIGGQELVEFLSKGADSARADSAPTDSAPKVSTDSKGGTPKDSRPGGTPGLEDHPYTRALPPGAVPGDPGAPTGDEGDSDVPATDFEGYSSFERWVVAATKIPLTPQQREKFQQKVLYLRDRQETLSLTVNEAYERLEEYREFVQDVIWMEIKNRYKRPSANVLSKWLNSGRQWERFEAWRTGQGFEDTPSLEDEKDYSVPPPSRPVGYDDEGNRL